MWWECSECGHQVENFRRPISCDECGVAGPIFVELGVARGDEAPDGQDWRRRWFLAGFERPHEVAQNVL